ncbi:mitochondrial 54S ribosomal protein bL9m MRPL50 Ecym_2097 [Eremothecium cymbalariae DBVPG|uniref:Ribosomal protein L9 domain-containing protein n=1 Tax=Eremothecium cymbalariae (strain CBS 270.75 / DBVPG 7215 / KCTC 17166 / NRRL Y-17582) TaxID=931890 RepID=G8JPK1_ERECY|nr:Hypothetical protein Ecym_2097 [Eremothecium cymbalariae DBVPG\
MFKPSLRVCSALTKRNNRVKVQLLKDFPRFQLYKGEVANVKPSLMRNFLHNNNGARYILKDDDINQELLLASKSVDRQSSQVVLQPKMETAKVSPKEEKPEISVQHEQSKRKYGITPGLTVEDVKIPGLRI